MSDVTGTYKKRYKMQVVGRQKNTTIVTIPPEVIERKAEEVGLTPEEFIKRYHAVAQFDNFDGVLYTFEPREEKQP